MKSVFRFLALGILTTTFAAAGFAQAAPDACADITAKQALYKTFTDLYPKTSIDDRKAAVSAAKEYIEKYGSCPEDKDQVTYFKGYIPTVEAGIIKDSNAKIIADRHTRFDTAMKAKNYDEAYAAGKEIIEQEKEGDIGFNVGIVLGSIGLDESAKSNTKYNADTIKYAQAAIDQINAGKSSKSFGLAYPDANYSYVSKDYPDTKSNALGWLNYTIGYLKYYVDKSDTAKKEAIPYFYKVSQLNSVKKKRPEIYYAIGLNYYTELDRLDTDRLAKIKAAGNKDTDETKEIFAMEKGYADRVIDAYSRVYNLVPNDPKSKSLKDSTYADLKNVYTLRYQNKGTTTLDSLIASTTSKPMVDPATAVTPVIEVEPTPAATTGTTTTPAATTPTTTTKPATTVKPATTTTTKPAATTVKPTTAPTKPVAKKTTPKR